MIKETTVWNYRVIRTKYTVDSVLGTVGLDDKPREHCEIKEVYYDKQPDCLGGEACNCPITDISEDAILPLGESVEELRRDLEAMLKAFDRPVIDDDDPRLQKLKETEQ